jgi:hypothetical protein
MPYPVAASRPKSLSAPAASTLLLGLVSYWPLEEASGTRYDVVGTNHLTDNNTVTSAAGKVDTSAEFTAANSESLSINSNTSIQCGDIDFTFAAWVNLGAKTGSAQIISKINSGGGKVEYDFSWVGAPTHRYRLSVAKPTDNWVYVDAVSGGNVDLDTWHLIVAWHDHALDKLYIQVDNGTVDSVATGGALQAASTADLYFGYRQWVGAYLTGKIDEAGFWKRILTTDERSALWNGGAGLTYPFSNEPYFPISITSPMAYTTFQRDGSGEADIPITGTYRGTPDSIEASWNGGAWAVIDAAPAGNTFSGTLAGQSQGQGTLQVRFSWDHSATASRPYIGIGDVFVVAGQSNASGYATNNQAYSHATLKATMFAKDYLWHNLSDPTHTNANVVDAVTNDTEAAERGSIWPLLATEIMAHENVPVAFIVCAKGSTGLLDGIGYWPAAVDHLDRTTLYGAMHYRTHQANGVKALLWWEGESEINTSRSEAEYHAALVALATDVVADLGVKVMPCKLQDCTDKSETNVNNAIGDAWTNHSDVILTGPDLHGLTTDDTWHLISDINQQTAADLWWAALHVALYGG